MRFLSGTFCALWLGFCASTSEAGQVTVSFSGLTLNIVGSNEFDQIAINRNGSFLYIEGLHFGGAAQRTVVTAGSGAQQVSETVARVPLRRVWNLSISMLAGHDYVGIGAPSPTYGSEFWTLLGNLSIDMGAGFGTANDSVATDGGDQVQIYFLTTLFGQTNISLTGRNDPDSSLCGNLFDMASCTLIAPFSITMSDNPTFNGVEFVDLQLCRFFQSVNIQCGAGDDTVNLSIPNDLLFFGPVTISGGSDMSGAGGFGDYISGSPTFLSPPSITGFEVNDLPGN